MSAPRAEPGGSTPTGSPVPRRTRGRSPGGAGPARTSAAESLAPVSSVASRSCRWDPSSERAPYRARLVTDERSGSESAITIPGMGDHDAPESVIRIERKERSGWTGTRTQGDFNDALTSRSSNVMTVVTPPVGTPIATTLGVPGPWNPSGMIAEPVNTATGNYVIQSLDLVIPGRGLPSVFSRTYNSLSTYFGPLGHAWTHSYNVFLTEGANGVVVIKQGDGHREYYQSQGTGAFKPITAGIFSTLVKNADGTFTLTFKDQRQYHFDSTGTLTQIADRNGNAQLLTYDGFGNLATITDAVGRVITLAYDASNRLIHITDPIGRQIQCTYDLSSNLATVTDPLGGAVHFFYDPAHHITRVVDQRGTAAVVNTYDGSGRVISQSNGRGFTTSFTYDSPNAGDTSVTDPLGRVTVHTHDALLSMTKITDSRS